MKILVFNVKYSDNLGDGLLALCLEKALAEGGEDVKVETIDLAGRTAFGSTHRRRTTALRVLEHLPSPIRRALVAAILSRKMKGLRLKYDRALRSADAIVLGGGNLFQDDDLNFPIKVAAALDCVARSGKPLAIHAVGVSARWSGKARDLFGRISRTNLVSVSVRDDVSLANWKIHFPDGPVPSIAPDPGLLANELSLPDVEIAHIFRRKMLGVCVTAPMILRRHASIDPAAIPLSGLADYSELIRNAIDRGYRVNLFTNGAREDQSFAERVAGLPELATIVRDGRLSLAERPERPEDLLVLLQSATVVLAHRLHACIACYSLGIPHVGLGWDNKLPGFFDRVGRGRYCLSGKSMTVGQIIATLGEANTEGIDRNQMSTFCMNAKSSTPTFLRSALEYRPSQVEPGRQPSKNTVLTAFPKTV
ncbi:MAG: polysaccharide pyruvyl transferase family protein [Rhizobium sp.]|nr:polysaccharide pyruvyl transferase family protein [Rhizobium sp.]